MRFLLLPLALFAAAPAFAQSEKEKIEGCLAKIDKDPEAAYQDGLSWLAHANIPAARQCTALALVALGQEAEGAERLEELANAPDAGEYEARAIYLVQAGNAWLLAGMPAESVVALTNAIKLAPKDGEVRKDRARAYVSEEKWQEAGDDLDAAIELGAGDAEAYRMRGLALLKLSRLPEAWEDVEAAQKLAPKDVNVLVLRGDVREAMRIAGMEDPVGLDQTLESKTRIVGN